MSPTIATLTERVALAEDEVFRVQMADGFAFTNGSYDRACSVLRQARAELREAHLQEMEAIGARIVATGRQIVTNITGENRA